jgi:hypothetical protein
MYCACELWRKRALRSVIRTWRWWLRSTA